MAKKIITNLPRDPAARLGQLAGNIEAEVEHWKFLRDNGGCDPAWTDGTNMQLTVNHIISYKREIREICEETGSSLPDEFYIPTPPATEKTYMCRTGKLRKKREELIRAGTTSRTEFTYKPPKYDEMQMTLF